VQEQAGGLTARQLAPLRPHADYVALGHIHKPFVREDWVHNPGSPETCSTQEATWPERGYYLVEVDTGRAEGPAHRATLHANARRPFFSITLHVDSYESPQQLYDRCEELVKRRARDHGASRLSEDSRPVVVLHLTGVLPFDRSSLEIARLESIVRTSYQPLHVIVRNNVRATEFPVEVGETVNRSQLERLVLEDLFRRDARFRGQSNRWARIALGLKGLALEGADPATIVDELERQMAELQDGDTAQDNADPRG
jgi:DNA repair exonuclease SbcCD nuclease subunit